MYIAFTDMRTLITGGAGYLGRGFLRRSSPEERSSITIYSRDETKQDECRRRYPEPAYVLGDVRDVSRLTDVMRGHDLVIHAAALKYIPEAELNAAECVTVNIDGARNIIAAAKAAHVQTVVGISTDKACQPVNVYGASKMVMERLFADEAVMSRQTHREHRDGPRFVCVRYGNVVGSTGSVLPLFVRQYEELGRVQVTDLSMTRFWMSVDEALDLIKVAVLHASNGSVVIPETRATTILDAARAATVDDVEVEVIGTRPGEKHHETLIHYEESVRVRRLTGIDGYFELLLPGDLQGTEAFTLSSHSPNHRLATVDLRRMLKDAASV